MLLRGISKDRWLDVGEFFAPNGLIFNPQLASDNSELEYKMGCEVIGKMSENGVLLAGFCRSCLTDGTLFPHKRIHKVTWISPDNTTENQIDNITISTKWRGFFLDIRNRSGTNVAYIGFKIASVKRNKDGAQNKFDVSKL